MSSTSTMTSPRRARSSWFDRAEQRPGLLTIAVSLLAILISLVNITHVSLWVDEAYTVTVATRSVADIWRMVHVIDVVHSLFNLLLHPWFALVGVSELTVRLPSILAVGVATAGVMVLTRQLAGSRAALAAGLVFAVLPRVTWAGIEGRSYATTAAVAVWLTVLFVSLCRRPTVWKYVGYAVLGAFAGSLNIFLVLLLGAHGVTMLLDRRLRFSRLFWTWLGAAVAALLGATPVLLTAVSQSGQIGANRLSPLGYARNVVVNQWFLGDTPTIYLTGGGPDLDGPGSQLWKAASVLLAGVCWLLMAWVVARREGGTVPPAPTYRPLLVSWLMLPTVILAGYAAASTPIYNPRYLTFGAPAVAILLGIGLVRLSRWRWAAVLATGLIVLLALPVYVSQRTANAKSGADWQEVAAFVSAHRAPDQAVYYAPRTPPVNGRITTTARTVQTLYPAAFAGIRDLTVTSTPAQSADLLGRSEPLAGATDRLVGISSVFLIRRIDYPNPALTADEEVLIRAGFRPGDQWAGPLNVVTEFNRAS